MAEEAGGRSKLEKVIEDWIIDAKFREMSDTGRTDWDTADRLAMALLSEM